MEGPPEAIEAWIEEWTGTLQMASVPFAYGTVDYGRRGPGEDHVAVVQALAGALELGHLRYSDLQAADERAAQSAREAAYERVRGAVLASRSSEDILGAASLMWRELRDLGVDFTACAINLIDEEAGEFRQLIATEEAAGEAPSSLEDTDDSVLPELMAHWRRSETWMRPAKWSESDLQTAKERGGEEAIRYLNSLRVIVDVPFS